MLLLGLAKTERHKEKREKEREREREREREIPFGHGEPVLVAVKDEKGEFISRRMSHNIRHHLQKLMPTIATHQRKREMEREREREIGREREEK